MESLPRLAYVGDVPVRSISAGPALLYRLFESWPAERLLVVEEAGAAPDPARQLPGVRHVRRPLIHQRLMHSRLSELYGSWLLLTCARHGGPIARLARSFRAEGIVSVGHGYGWIAAARAARLLGVPLHLIVHDHWRDFLTVAPGLSARAERMFGAVYRQAASRLPISPAMEEKYRRLYGCPGTVLYPCRSRDALRLDHPPHKEPLPGRFVFAYAGSTEARWARRALASFANATARLGVRLRVYQGVSVESLRAEGYSTDSIEIVPFLPAADLHRDLAARVDAMFLPMSFEASDRSNVEVCFPSKLTDYTVPGLPLLVYAPGYGTAARWAVENDPAAELVTTQDEGLLVEAVARIAGDQDRRGLLARRALELGRAQFSQERIFGVFCAAVAGARSGG